jgi:SnoaL-like domain
MKGLNGMPDAKELLHSNLHEVFSEGDTERRRLAIQRTYSEDVVFIDPEGEFAGRQALSDQAQKVLDGAPAGFVFEEDGPQYVGTDTAALPWRFRPPGSPAVRGIDILTIREGRVSVVHTLIVPDTNA